MRVVLDTNVLVSAVLSPGGAPSHVLQAWRKGAFHLVVSAALLDELREVLARPSISGRLGWSTAERTEFVAVLAEVAVVVSPAEELDVVEADPADNRVLEAGVAGQADYVVSGDRHLLALAEYEGASIIPPARFAALLAAESLQ